MKRTVCALLMLLSFTAYAEPQKNPECPDAMLPPGHLLMRPGYLGGASLSHEEARDMFVSFLAEKLKGFQIKEINSVFMPFGSLHQATVTDASGNMFYLNISPDGKVSGLFAVK